MPKKYKSGAELSEWSYLVDIEHLSSDPKTFTFVADEEERVDLARRFGIVSVEKAEASVTAQAVGGGVVHAIGHVRADVTQSCIATLVPVLGQIEDEFEGWFGDHSQAVSFARARSEREAKKSHMEAEILEESIDPEPVVNGKVDLGELATQYLSLALNPYPRAEGVPYEFTAGPSVKDEDGASLRKNPFEALKDWKENR